MILTKLFFFFLLKRIFFKWAPKYLQYVLWTRNEHLVNWHSTRAHGTFTQWFKELFLHSTISSNISHTVYIWFFKTAYFNLLVMSCKYGFIFSLILISFQLSVKMCERASKGCLETDCLHFTRLLKGFGEIEVIERGIHLIKMAYHVLFKQLEKCWIYYSLFQCSEFFFCVLYCTWPWFISWE